MDGGEGGASRCMEGGRGVDNDINRILLKYRPIAPKPVVGESWMSSGGSSLLSGKRIKRKYVRVSSNRFKNKYKEDKADEKEEEKRIVTLQLLPEKVDPEDRIAQLDALSSNLNTSEHNNNNNNNNFEAHNSNFNRGIVSSRVVESWIVVESVENNLYSNDQCPVIWSDSIVRNQLEGDSYPGFISKAESGKVEWVNEAYKRMVVCESDTLNQTPLMVVRLEIKDAAAEALLRVGNGFSCWVKVQYNGVSIVLPCDACRVESGGFAWRLDARAALCLGNVNGRLHPS